MGDIKLKKSEGQHILKNHGLIDTIIEKAHVKHTDTVLEIGAGTGSITLKLLQKAKKVIAYETDKKLARELIHKVNMAAEFKNKLELIQSNVLRQNIPHFDLCISNIPFNISCPIILKLISYDFKCAYILVQKEFGDRLTARPGSDEYSRLSVIVQLLANVEHVMKVSKNSFMPPPKVDTCFMKIEPKIPRPPININEFDVLLKACFGRKNKTLLANLKTPLIQGKITKVPEYSNLNPASIIDQIVDSIGLTDARTSKMGIDDFLLLLLEFKKANIHFD
ncbi:dimethyladenosine transferase [Vittaforma corneae ATCC 50505]|uniref:rRNA adenine N(6)-methyltransferase n=1 Tax=Vittaforma corneae (strain ATCC 50505) TaxID=993615 RepID=L2GQ59_VITCO|nr:dimethyladenosine transferase [Vittaforma corneae ATCC 50505]ELA42462.1 dimethyladenosine transferase [Vittaforma corneae ATCC 50505]